MVSKYTPAKSHGSRSSRSVAAAWTEIVSARILASHAAICPSPGPPRQTAAQRAAASPRVSRRGAPAVRKAPRAAGPGPPCPAATEAALPPDHRAPAGNGSTPSPQVSARRDTRATSRRPPSASPPAPGCSTTPWSCVTAGCTAVSRAHPRSVRKNPAPRVWAGACPWQSRSTGSGSRRDRSSHGSHARRGPSAPPLPLSEWRTVSVWD